MGFKKKTVLGRASVEGTTTPTADHRRNDLVVIYRPKPISKKKKRK
jgi:hypothetical protein